MDGCDYLSVLLESFPYVDKERQSVFFFSFYYRPGLVWYSCGGRCPYFFLSFFSSRSALLLAVKWAVAEDRRRV